MEPPVLLTLAAIAGVSAVPLLALPLLLRGEAYLVAALPYLLGLAVGALLGAALFHLYIAASDLIPELQRETGTSRSVAQVALVACGALLMLLLA